MRYKARSGVTVVSVLIIVVILSVLAGIVTISTNYILEETFKKEYSSEYSLVKSATNDYVLRNSGIVDFEETELHISSIDTEYLAQFEGENIVNNKIQMYIIDLEKIGIYNATYGINAQEDDVYLLSKDTKQVYYKRGFDDGDK